MGNQKLPHQRGRRAWGDDEAKALVGKAVIFDAKKLTVNGKACVATIKKSPTPWEYETDEPPVSCGTAKATGEYFSIDLKCAGAIEFPPYLFKLKGGGLAASGDGVTLCLSR